MAGAGRVAAGLPTIAAVFDKLAAVPAVDHPELLPPVVFAALRHVPSALVFSIDPEHADTETLARVHGLPMEIMANAVLVQGRRGGDERQACCMTLAHRRVDVNNMVRRRLDVRKASFAPMEVAVAASGMEYGGITPVGLPEEWPLLVAPEVAAAEHVVVGSGIRGSKLAVPGALVASLPGAEVLEDLARPVG